MNKQQLAHKVAEITGIQKGDAETIVEVVFETIGDTTASGDFVNIAGFGKFDSKETKARTAQNIKEYTRLVESGVSKEDAKAQTKVDVPASKKPTFKPASALKDKIKQ